MALSRIHERRLRTIYRSAGWPCLDAVEIELLAAGLVERVAPPQAAEYLRVTDAGIRQLDCATQRNRSALSRHETLVQRMAEEQLLAGRLAWRGLTLLGKPGSAWLHLRPDLYSIRRTTAEEHVLPVIHEIKVERSDLKADLRKPDKRAGYIALCSQFYYVLAEGIADPGEIPPECGVIIAGEHRLALARPAPARPFRPAFHDWMALARADRFRSSAHPKARL